MAVEDQATGPNAMPMSAPANEPRSRGTRRAYVVVVLFALALLACTWLALSGVGRSIGEAIGGGSAAAPSGGQTLAAWSGDGKWIFAQGSDARGVSSITAVRIADGKRATLGGYWLVAIEPAGSRARVVADPGRSPFDFIGRLAESDSAVRTADTALVSPESLTDVPGVTTLAWDPEVGETPMAGPWAEAVDTGGRRAGFVVDPARGIEPCEIRLTAESGSLSITSPRTMQPVGWSASGRYYAALELPVEPGVSVEAPASGGRRAVLVIWDVARKLKVSTTTVEPGIASRIVWSPVEDAIYWTDRGEETGQFDAVRFVRPDGQPAAGVLAAFEPSSAPMVAGVDERGVLVRELLSTPSDAPISGTGSTVPKECSRIGLRSDVSDLGSDHVGAFFTEARTSGVLWWTFVAPQDEAEARDVTLSTAGVRVWWAPSIDATPELVIKAGYQGPATAE